MTTNILRRAFGIFSILVLLASLFVSSVNAKAPGSVVFQIPFDFVVAGKTLPAGEYIIVRSTLASDEILSIRSLDKSGGVYVLTSTLRASNILNDSKLVFNRYQDQYFLSEFWISGQDSGRKVIKSEKERALARDVAKAGTKVERVAIATRQK
ncbi:MAG: hypothetical protein DMF68_03635 [Acidobacteria bacterium]|nr:MAG: hypothetical protein DMF68_03635 [Acidobacteriota bacterium]